jgi:hypothetical protein
MVTHGWVTAKLIRGSAVTDEFTGGFCRRRRSRWVVSSPEPSPSSKQKIYFILFYFKCHVGEKFAL